MSRRAPNSWRIDLALAARRALRRGGETALGIVTVAVAVAAVFFVASLGNGLHAYLTDRLSLLTPALWVDASLVAGPAASSLTEAALLDAVQAAPNVASASPHAAGPALVRHGNAAAAASLAGYDLAALPKVLPGIIATLEGLLPAAPHEALVGADLARSLGLELGDTFVLVGTGAPPAEMKVAGLVRSGYAPLDQALVITAHETARTLLADSGESGIAVSLLDPADLEATRLELQRRTGSWVRPWYEGRTAVYAALEVERRVMFWISLTAVGVAAVAGSALALLRVIENRFELGIMQAVGATSGALARTILAESLVNSAAGGVLGGSLGWLLVAIGQRVRLRMPAEFGTDHLPLEPAWSDFASAFLLTLGATLLASIYPAWRAGRIRPADALRRRA